MGHGVTMSLPIGSTRTGRLRHYSSVQPVLKRMGRIMGLVSTWCGGPLRSSCSTTGRSKAHELGWTKLGANKQHYSTVQAVLELS